MYTKMGRKMGRDLLHTMALGQVMYIPFHWVNCRWLAQDG
jgi:hypothetical protein